jgi:hypothetical protein
MNYMPIYTLILIALAGVVLFFAFRMLGRRRLARDDRGRIAQQARNAERWEQRNDSRSD